MSGGETTCSHTRPRSSDIDEMRLPYDSSGRVSSQRSREQTVVASSSTFIRCVLREQREDAVRVVRGDRLPVLRGQVAVHDRGLRALGGVVDRVRVLEPGGVLGQLREARDSASSSSSSFASTSVFEGSSSSSTTTIGARATPPIVRASASPGNASSEIWPLQQEQQQEHERHRREHVEERAHGLGPRPERGERGADRHAQRDQHGVRGVERLLERLRGDQRDQHADEHDVRALGEPPAGSGRAAARSPAAAPAAAPPAAPRS